MIALVCIFKIILYTYKCKYILGTSMLSVSVPLSDRAATNYFYMKVVNGILLSDMHVYCISDPRVTGRGVKIYQ